ncbi:MAG: hypothetical protein JWO56_808 [Acidobacteria bacterium]|nr:hypothetical protein [Acidobacteriota bacterium]
MKNLFRFGQRTRAIAALLAIAATATVVAASLGEDVSLPVVEVATAHRSDTFAVIVTGDGGWRAIDRDIAAVLASRGVPAVGLVASSYFAERRTTNESSAALDRLIRTYSRRWQRPRAILIGYSRGAGVLPFMISRLPVEQRSRISAVALLGLDAAIDFKTSASVLLWHADDDLLVPVRPELGRLRGLPLLCVAGQDDTESICRSLPPDLSRAVMLPGGHHFGGNYRAIADRLLATARVRR